MGKRFEVAASYRSFANNCWPIKFGTHLQGARVSQIEESWNGRYLVTIISAKPARTKLSVTRFRGTVADRLNLLNIDRGKKEPMTGQDRYGREHANLANHEW